MARRWPPVTSTATVCRIWPWAHWLTVDQSALQTNDDYDGFADELVVADWNGDGKRDLAALALGLPHGAKSNPVFLFKGQAATLASWMTRTLP